MINAKVVGIANATLKHSSLEGRKMIVVQPYGLDGTTPDGHPLIAVDTCGVGTGERVVLTSDGRTSRELLQSDTTPVRWTVLGIMD